MSSVRLLRRLGNHSCKNRLYRAFREQGRVIRTITNVAVPVGAGVAGADHRDHQQGRGVPRLLGMADGRREADRGSVRHL